MKFKLIMSLILVLGFAPASWALIIVNEGQEQYQNKKGENELYGYYANSGSLLFLTEGNEEGDSQYARLQSIMHDIYNVSLLRADSGLSYSLHDDQISGTWFVSPQPNTISFYTVKSSSFFAMYMVNPPAGEGSFSTFHIFIPGTLTTFNLVDGVYTASFADYDGHNSFPQGDGIEISHFWGYNLTPVPEPSTFLLLGMGLAGLAFCARRRMKK